MLLYNRSRFAMTILGISLAYFLAAAQVGLLVGWIHTNSAIINHAGVDIWVMSKGTRTLDYGTAIPRQRIQQTLSVPGVKWAEGMLVGWVNWQHPEGKRITVEVIGLDNGNAGGPWRMSEGDISAVHLPETVIVDELSRQALGIIELGQETEMEGKRVIIGGFSQGVRTFTAAPFVFTSIENALDYVPYYRDDEISFVLVNCENAAEVKSVRDRIAMEINDVEVLTTEEFADRSVKYWMLETGVGITVIITASLGLLVGVVIMSQTLFSITQDHINNYATLLALGFHQKSLRSIILTQSLILGGGGITIGSLLFVISCQLTALSPIPLETTPLVSTCLTLFSMLFCVAGSWFSIRAVFKLDPVSVFH
ncbi:ABC transporter permease [Methylomonas sp. SURF-1]|uniref:ABC transporter permease n=1 Tax=Methylomonas aurea TaxID=2952224 RepID=A0ABT1UDP7_9GAMM|nr:ABC transporter permease [Methylomonas sp. SURF-1]MCQ8180343.1 ABC transporter permease [Methylomonas sp. SURF-1]